MNAMVKPRHTPVDPSGTDRPFGRLDARGPAILAVLLAACLPAGLWASGAYLLPPPDTDLVGAVRSVRVVDGQDLADIARNEDIGHLAIRAANPDVDFWLPGAGSEVVVPAMHILPPAARRGIVLNLPELRLYYYPPPPAPDVDAMVVTHPISIGRMAWGTPVGEARVTGKVRNPSWTPPDSIHAEAREDGRYLPRVVPPGPDNPLGEYALRLSLPGYLIHGTNKPYGVGMRVTHGCIRMYPEDIEALFPRVSVGTPVTILNEPVKVGWSGGALYVEVHAPLEEHDGGEAHLLVLAHERVAAATRERPVSWSEGKLEKAVRERTGIPVRVSPP